MVAAKTSVNKFHLAHDLRWFSFSYESAPFKYAEGRRILILGSKIEIKLGG